MKKLLARLFKTFTVDPRKVEHDYLAASLDLADLERRQREISRGQKTFY